jgi:hypothetical protein
MKDKFVKKAIRKSRKSLANLRCLRFFSQNMPPLSIKAMFYNKRNNLFGSKNKPKFVQK